jgi:endonuclease VIII
MPEGDTVHLAATRLDRALRGEMLLRTDFRVPRLAMTDLAGRRVLDVRARGKHLLFRIDGGVTLHTHFRMDGEWHLYPPGRAPRARSHEVRAVLETEGIVAVGVRLPVVELIRTQDETRLLAHLGPDVLGEDWDPDEALLRLRRVAERPVGEALVDQRNLAGLGNVYKCEICFLAGVNPYTRVGDVPDLEHVVGLAKRTMEANRTTGMQATTGETRRGRRRWVYGRRAEPCRRCGTAILKSGPSEERVTYWCPRCQPEGK